MTHPILRDSIRLLSGGAYLMLPWFFLAWIICWVLS